MIVTYQPEQIPIIWLEVEPFVESALERGSAFSKEDIYEGLRKTHFQLWTWQTPSIKALMVTCIYEKSCLLLLMAGESMSEWKDSLPLVEEWAKDKGCQELLIQGRKGWSKVLGFEITGRDSLGLHKMRKAL